MMLPPGNPVTGTRRGRHLTDGTPWPYKNRPHFCFIKLGNFVGIGQVEWVKRAAIDRPPVPKNSIV
jgi:hypothetical protein